MDNSEPNPTIRHLVLSGGGPIMVQMLGALQELEHRGFIDMSTIQTMYGTSAGALLAVALALRFDWETLNDYILKRPWQDVFGIKIQQLLDAYSNKGIFGASVVEKCFKPLFDAKDISIQITLLEFYEWSKIELHLFAFDVNAYHVVRVSHKTHPDLPLLTAVQMTCALPVLMTPVFLDGQCLMDGGVACNYPLSFCVEDGHAPNEILGLKNQTTAQTSLDEQSNLLDYLLNFLFKAVFHVQHSYSPPPPIPHEVVCDTRSLTLEVLSTAIQNAEVRKQLFDQGKESARVFLEGQVGSLREKDGV